MKLTIESEPSLIFKLLRSHAHDSLVLVNFLRLKTYLCRKTLIFSLFLPLPPPLSRSFFIPLTKQRELEMKNFNNYSPKKTVQRIPSVRIKGNDKSARNIIFLLSWVNLKNLPLLKGSSSASGFSYCFFFSFARSLWNDLWHFSWHLRLITFFFFSFYFFLLLRSIWRAVIIFLRLFRWHFWFKKIVFSHFLISSDVLFFVKDLWIKESNSDGNKTMSRRLKFTKKIFFFVIS